ncbi:hypothetical protein [Pyxidicoccus xibeiensis]|uniref:hypothetical protein n=1 Tax=Pyxidicoccus xibeiensis TaxID=2906759 RepID=UPI0020A81C1A|nr:hypothetical protein [Pyxidicoccus xibeiensis]MCP3143089.1 hypothetical protein [Pyxidicoccus xibeiensis]
MAFDFDRVRSERFYRSTAPVAEVMADLDRLRHLDTEAKKARAAWKDRSFTLAFAGPGLLVVSLVLYVSKPGIVAGTGLTLGGVLIFGLFLSLFRVLRLKMVDLEERRYALALRVLQRLSEDIGPDEPVTLELDLHLTMDARNRTARGTSGAWKTEHFVNRWLSFQARLRDGTHLRLGMEQRAQHRVRERRNPRGRLKIKRKNKGTALIDVQLRVKPERHPGLARLGQDARKVVKLPPGVALARLEVTDDRLSLRSRMEDGWEAKPRMRNASLDAPRTVVMMLLSLYQVLNYSTALRKREAARATS